MLAACTMKRIGLLGGSFNPAHEGHRQLSLAAIEALGLDQWVYRARLIRFSPTILQKGVGNGEKIP